MRVVNEGTKIIRRSVEATGRKKINAVVAPAELTGEISDRHYFDRGNSNRDELGQLFGGRGPGALRCESANVHFVNDLAAHLNSTPWLIAPRERFWIDDGGGTMRSLRLRTRSGIGMEIFRVIQTEAVERARSRRRYSGKISIRLGLQRVKSSTRLAIG